MATLVFFHAHPDDEAIATGGTMAKLAAEGHRVVCVTATRGELGEVEDGFLSHGESLEDRRVAEMAAACEVLGVARHEFLGYRDSDMMGRAGNDDPTSFWRAGVGEAAGRLAAILEEEGADVLIAYDENGSYGHPDHIQVHRVGVRAAELAGTPRVYEATFDRDRVTAIFETMRPEDAPADDSPEGAPDAEGVPETFGSPGWLVTTRVDVRDHLATKRAAMAAHASQISETSFFLTMPDDVFEKMWGVEEYIRRGVAEGCEEESLVDGL